MIRMLVVIALLMVSTCQADISVAMNMGMGGGVSSSAGVVSRGDVSGNFNAVISGNGISWNQDFSCGPNSLLGLGATVANNNGQASNVMMINSGNNGSGGMRNVGMATQYLVMLQSSIATIRADKARIEEEATFEDKHFTFKLESDNSSEFSANVNAFNS